MPVAVPFCTLFPPAVHLAHCWRSPVPGSVAACVYVLAGTTACYMGIALITNLSQKPLAYWLAPALAVTGVLVIAGVVLEIRKLKECSGPSLFDTLTVFCWQQLLC